MSISVSVDTTKLNEILAKLPGNRDTVVRAAAFHVLGNAVKRAPHKTGFLKGSGKVDTEKAGYVNVEFWAEYAAYVELGTHNADGSIRMAARPFLKPAVEAERQIFIDRIKKGLIT